MTRLETIIQYQMPDILQPTAMKSAYKIVVLFIFSTSIMVEGSNPREPNRNEITHQRRETTGGLTGVISLAFCESNLPLENKMGKKTLRLFLIHSQFAAPSWPLGLGPKVKNGRINKIPRIQLHLWKPGKKFDQKSWFWWAGLHLKHFQRHNGPRNWLHDLD